MWYRYGLLVFLVFAVAGANAQDARDYLVKLNGDTLYGKVTHAPGELVNFKEEGKKVIIYRPFQITGYQHKEVFYISRMLYGRNIFYHYFREGDSTENFEKRTKFRVVASGKISLYHLEQSSYSPTGMTAATGSPVMHKSSQEAIHYDIKDNIAVTDSGIGSKGIKETLVNHLPVLKEYPDLYIRIVTDNNKFTLEHAAAYIREFNDWYKNKPVAGE